MLQAFALKVHNRLVEVGGVGEGDEAFGSQKRVHFLYLFPLGWGEGHLKQNLGKGF